MSEKTVRLTVDFTYDPSIIHGNDKEAIEWFNGVLMGDGLELYEKEDTCEVLGKIKVVERQEQYNIKNLKLCSGCGCATYEKCHVDMAGFTCGEPLCGNCRHVDEEHGWTHEPKNSKEKSNE